MKNSDRLTAFPNRQHPLSGQTLPEKSYLLLWVVGTLIPLYGIAQFLSQPTLGTVLTEAINNPLSFTFIADALISTVVFWVLLAVDAQETPLGQRGLVIVLASNVCIGLSSALPLFLYLRSRRLHADP